MKTKKVKPKEDFEIKFWKDWLHADELKRFDMVKKLPIVRNAGSFEKMPENLRKHSFAQLLNGYFEDLESAVYTKIRLDKKKAKK